MTDTDLARNLRFMCGFEKSVSEVCRAVGINRQQFSKYLNGSSQPSPYNLQRICKYFSLRPSDLMLPHEDLAGRLEFHALKGDRRANPGTRRILAAAFPGDRTALRRYQGYYLTHCHSFSWDGYILRAISHVVERDGLFCVKTIERTCDPDDGALFLSKYDGQVSLLGNRLFVIEHQSLANDAIVETVLYPTARSQLTLLRGVTFGVSSKQRNPYVSRSVWKFLGTNIDLKRALKATGLFSTQGTDIDPKVARVLGPHPFPNELLHYDLEPVSLR